MATRRCTQILAAGKPKTVAIAIVAARCKLPTVLNVIAQIGQPWDDAIIPA